MATSSAATYAESSRNLELEKQVAEAMAGIAKADGLVLDEADVERRDAFPRVPFATDKSCGGTGYCTGLVLYYEKEPCSPDMAELGYHTPGAGGNGRDWYTIKDRGICYQASGASEKQGREIADQLRRLDISRINAAWQAPSKIPGPYKQQATSPNPPAKANIKPPAMMTTKAGDTYHLLDTQCQFDKNPNAKNAFTPIPQFEDVAIWGCWYDQGNSVKFHWRLTVGKNSMLPMDNVVVLPK